MSQTCICLPLICWKVKVLSKILKGSRLKQEHLLLNLVVLARFYLNLEHRLLFCLMLLSCLFSLVWAVTTYWVINICLPWPITEGFMPQMSNGSEQPSRRALLSQAAAWWGLQWEDICFPSWALTWRWYRIDKDFLWGLATARGTNQNPKVKLACVKSRKWLLVWNISRQVCYAEECQDELLLEGYCLITQLLSVPVIASMGSEDQFLLFLM